MEASGAGAGVIHASTLSAPSSVRLEVRIVTFFVQWFGLVRSPPLVRKRKNLRLRLSKISLWRQSLGSPGLPPHRSGNICIVHV